MNAVIEKVFPGRVRATLNDELVGERFADEREARAAIERAMYDRYGLVPAAGAGTYART